MAQGSANAAAFQLQASVPITGGASGPAYSGGTSDNKFGSHTNIGGSLVSTIFLVGVFSVIGLVLWKKVK